MRLKGPNGIVNAKPLPGCRFDFESKVVYLPDNIGNGYVAFARDGREVWISGDGYVAKFTMVDEVDGTAGKEAVAPMTGKVVAMPVKIGQAVKVGDTLAILEAMKMEYRLEAEADGEVEAINAEVGELVDLGHVLVRLK